MNILGIPRDRVMDMWPSVEGYFRSFEERSHTSLGELLSAVLTGDKQMWVAYADGVKACALTSTLKGAVLTVEMSHCAGEGREEWQAEMVNEIRSWARHIGAKRFRTYSRPGWTPFLKSMGLKETHRVMEQDIE